MCSVTRSKHSGLVRTVGLCAKKNMAVVEIYFNNESVRHLVLHLRLAYM